MDRFIKRSAPPDGLTDNSMGWPECTVERKCGDTHETQHWVYYSCDKKETKHDFDTAAYGVNRAEGHRWVFAAAERLAVPQGKLQVFPGVDGVRSRVDSPGPRCFRGREKNGRTRAEGERIAPATMVGGPRRRRIFSR